MRPLCGEGCFPVLSSFVLVLLFLTGCGGSREEPKAEAVFRYRVVKDYPHDPGLFTQGLVVDGGIVFESSGGYGRSLVRKWDLRTGKVLNERHLGERFFGEGLTLIEDKLVQITWRENTGFVYDRESLVILKSFRYKGEGWGIAYDGEKLIMSDGSSFLRLINPKNFEEKKRIEAKCKTGPVANLNELEYVDGEILANIWQQDSIVKICPASGRVKGWINMEGLRDIAGVRGPDAVLNGIAYDRRTKRLYVTGKNWPRVFEIELIPYR